MNGPRESLLCSVVIPVHNRRDLLRGVLEGLCVQSVPVDAFEVLVCDDGGEEDLEDVTRDFALSLPHLRLLRQQNRGPASARNLGIREATSAVVLFLDSDVLPGESVIEALVDALNTHPDWQGAEARLEPTGGRDTVCWDGPRSPAGGHYHTAGVAYRKAVLLRVGGMDENFTRAACEDVELAVRVMEHGPIGFAPRAVVRHPRRRRTVGSCWRARRNWRFVQILACRDKFLSWPENKTEFPRLRTAIAAAATLPLSRLRRSLASVPHSPVDGLRGIGLSVVDWFGGLVMLPTILLGTTPRRHSSVASAKEPTDHGLRRNPACPPPARPVPPGKVAVVVATHTYCFPLEKCLTDLCALVETPRDVIFVDNGSGGELTRWAETHLPQVTVLTREVNGLFCAGYNEGVRYAVDRGYEHVLIVNADTEVYNPEFLNVMLDVAKRHPRAAFIGPKVYLREVGNVQNTVLTFPSSWRNLRSFVGVTFFGARPPASGDQEKEVEFLNGVCVLCRVDALREIGPLDEDMGGYVEDTDWAWRARDRDWTSVYTPVASIVHHQSEGGYEHYSLKSFMLRRNQIFWHWKNGRRFEARLYGFCAVQLARLRGVLATLSRAPDRGDFARFSARLKSVDKSIRSGRPLGEWFGPPFGQD